LEKSLSIQGGGEVSGIKHNSEFEDIAVHIGVSSKLHKKQLWPPRCRQTGSPGR
jgi:hypothetical protein